jgi:hypothetical protein
MARSLPSIDGLAVVLALLILVWLGLFSWLVVSVYQQEREWESFAVAHKCEVIRNDVTFWGTTLTFRCDDGVIYTRGK